MPQNFDVIIIGGGGAGLTAALYASRAKLSTALFEKLVPGGQIALTDIVENYPGFPDGVTGGEIATRMEQQAKKYGTQIIYEGVEQIQSANKSFEVKTAKNAYQAKAIIIASGAFYRQLGVPGEKELIGKGVSYCAVCDGAFFKNQELVVVGGGDSAMQEGLFLTRFASKITVVHRRDQLRASPILQERAKNHEKINFIWNSVVSGVEGKDKMTAVKIKNVKTQEEKPFKANGLFVFIGQDPATSYLKGFVDLDEKGYVETKENLETSVPGVFACGEVRAGAVKQLVSACGEGCEAALAAQHYIENT
ncbi:MAG: thioredoxin-disulfide reductase [Candidatus Omnitrophica bacterium CG11_big_fil_rev_8_21_14_0_20_45_26]|uniref:Thioredoxin reductase n=1 Tax=Candidatus Abzuiibacterium crystallinum TaxID=1974748 RepID=A0A2H0LMN0_9BACT|nr:MAG: thioredoxin-disulfide reductase [Candidatus Omnitrophica bacterium CG11_big_fil_rev_8_21_14_0_20_45_26]PIW65152.1 MAG: thioredoxin-disulfide reductase [Candidatus Omnitrophica bacterium CG12_big_fil_rev_8_21_14_0_65_45_16]